MSFKLRIQNYQAIADAELEIDGFTVVMGPTNVGKSSIVRAFKGLVENQGGDAFIRAGEMAAVVTLDTGDLKVQWRKGQDSGYTVDEKGKDQQIYTSLSKGQPAFIPPLGFGEIKLGTHKVKPQIGPQFPMEPFLLQKPGSFIAEAISSVTGIDKVPPAIRAAEKDLRSMKSEQKVRRGDLKSAQKDLADFGGLADADIEFAAVLFLWKGVEEIDSKVIQLNELVSELDRAQTTVDLYDGVDAIQVPCHSVWTEVEKADKAVATLKALISDLGQAQTAVDQYTDLDVIAVPDLTPLQDQLTLVIDMRSQLADLRSSQAEARALRGVFDIEVPDLGDLEQTAKQVQTMKTLAVELLAAKTAANQFSEMEDMVIPVLDLDATYKNVLVLRQLVHDLDEAKANAKRLKAEATDATDRFVTINVEFTEALGDTCPLCDQGVDDDNRHADHAS